MTTISQSGAPQGPRYLLLWNPPIIDRSLGIRGSVRNETFELARHAIARGLKTIVFTLTRLAVELLTKSLKEAGPASAGIKSYRGGYLPSERREIERQLRRGEIDCVVATVALELGVDIGSLDVAIVNGYPGTIAGTWQRLGRAGRRNRPSLGVLVANSSPIDQYLMRHPDFFLGASPEHAHVDPDQPQILMDHLRCAAFELPFRDGEAFGKQDVARYLARLMEERVIHRERDRWHWMAEGYPAADVSLRSAVDDNFVVIDVTEDGSVIAEVDYASAPTMLYEGAIYLVQAQLRQVERLDWVGRKAFVRETTADYYTESIEHTHLAVLETFEDVPSGEGYCSVGEVHVTRQVVGYKKIRFGTYENLGNGPVTLPAQTLDTMAVWWTVGPEALDQTCPSTEGARAALAGAAYAIHFVATLLAMCELRDLGRTASHVSAPKSGEDRSTAIFLYDNHPGGIGLTRSLFDLRDELLEHAQELIRACECSHGCPACIGPVPDEHETTRKQAAHGVLAMLRCGK